MDGSIRLRVDERKRALHVLRRGSDPELRLRAHILLLLDARQPWVLIVAVLFTSTSTINRWRRRFLGGGLAAVLGQTRPVRSRWWVALVVRWVTEWTPGHFGFVRSRWTCEAVAIVLREDHRVRVSRETIRRQLRKVGLGRMDTR
jgi:putative transposase